MRFRAIEYAILDISFDINIISEETFWDKACLVENPLGSHVFWQH